jgi:hypothetical protein
MIDGRKPGLTVSERERTHLLLSIRRRVQNSADRITGYILVGLDNPFLQGQPKEGGVLASVPCGRNLGNKQNQVDALIGTTGQQTIAGLFEVLFYHVLSMLL